MKGLLVKDFCLLRQRGKFFLLLGLLTVFMSYTMDSAMFVVGWVSMLMAIFSLSTLSYDEFDNCMPFLMSLPITPRDYALEKYLFGFLCGTAGWIFGIIARTVMLLILDKGALIPEEILGTLAFPGLILLLLAICIPVELKWGPEKGRTYLLVIYGVFFVGLALAMRFLSVKVDIDTALADVHPLPVMIGIIVLAVLIAAGSVLLSIRIMKNKEF